MICPRWITDILTSNNASNSTSKALANGSTNIALEQLIKLRSSANLLSFSQRHLVNTYQSGHHLSRSLGRGMDFDEVRHYQVGDEIRHLDWKVTARTGRPHTKLFREERERPVFFIVNFSQSMYFGTRQAFKSVVAAQVTALLAWAAITQGHRVGGLIFGHDGLVEWRPKQGTQGVLPLLKSLADLSSIYPLTPNPLTLTEALIRLRKTMRPGSRLFLITDFTPISYATEQHLAPLAQRNILTWISIYDALEKKLPVPNDYTLTDGKNITTLNTRMTSLCNAYTQQFKEQQHNLNNLLKRYLIHGFSLATHQAILATLQLQLRSQ